MSQVRIGIRTLTISQAQQRKQASHDNAVKASEAVIESKRAAKFISLNGHGVYATLLSSMESQISLA